MVIGGMDEWGRRVLAVVGSAAVADAEGCSLGELVGVLWGCVGGWVDAGGSISRGAGGNCGLYLVGLVP